MLRLAASPRCLPSLASRQSRIYVAQQKNMSPLLLQVPKNLDLFFLKRTTYTGTHMVYRLYILIKIELVTSVVEHYSCWHVFIKPNCSGMDSEWKSRVSFHIIFKVVLNHNNLTTPSMIRTTHVRFDKSVICPWWRASVLYNLYDKSSQMSYNKPIKIPLETVMCTFWSAMKTQSSFS